VSAVPHLRWADRQVEAGPSLRVTQVRSGIGSKPKTRGTLRALGLRGPGRVNLLPDRPEVRGMLARVRHLVRVEEKPREEAGAGGRS
jgi:large subunit ribosomal protein L30